MIKTAYIKHEPGHKNSKGQASPWVIYDHDDGKIISSHKTHEDAEKHLQQIHIFSQKNIQLSKIASIEELLSAVDDSISKLTIKKIKGNDPIGYITLNELYDPESQTFSTEITEVKMFENPDNIKEELQKLSPMPWRDLRDSIEMILNSSELYFSFT
jgi:hypothetical protein